MQPPFALCQADVGAKIILVMAVITFKYKMHVIFSALAHDFQPKFPWRSGILRFKSDLSRVCCTSSRQRAFKLPHEKSTFSFAGLKSHNLMAAEGENQQRELGECWSDLELYQLIQRWVFFKWGSSGRGRWKSRLVDPWETPYLFFVGPAHIDHAHCCACPIEAGVNEPAA